MKKFTIIAIALVSLFQESKAQSTFYDEDFESYTSITQLEQALGWTSSNISLNNSSKITGSVEVMTDVLNPTSPNASLTTWYFQGNSGTNGNTFQFNHVIDNASGIDIQFTVMPLDVNDVQIVDANNIPIEFTYTYNNASLKSSSWSFTYTGLYKLHFEWTGFSVNNNSGSNAFLDFLQVNTPFIPLPVKLIDFNAQDAEQGKLIRWVTAEESNVMHYEVFRSADGTQFNAIGTVQAKAAGSMEYSLIDQSPLASAYYKIRIVDTDGSSYWSRVIFTGVDQKTLVANVYPNPAQTALSVNFTSEASELQVSISDAYGKTVDCVSTFVNGNTMNFDISSLESGVYFIRSKNADGSEQVSRFIKQ